MFQWYFIILKKNIYFQYRLVARTALKLLLAFGEYTSANAGMLYTAISEEDKARGQCAVNNLESVTVHWDIKKKCLKLIIYNFIRILCITLNFIKPYLCLLDVFVNNFRLRYTQN